MNGSFRASAYATEGSAYRVEPLVEGGPLVAAGDVIADKYRIDGLLGFGGMGYVYRGYHLELEQSIAVKFIRPELSEHAEVVERFMNEARAAASLKSQHIVHVLDVGRLPCGTPYLVMEHLDGEDLETLLDRDGPLPFSAAVDYVLEACQGLEEAHAARIIHRDIKLENLFIAEIAGGRRLLKVLDFGIAKRVETSSDLKGLTSPGDSIGSPLYMSPEQMSEPQSVDGRADIWALGVVLYQLLAGRPPFDGETVPEVCARVLTAAPAPLGQHRPDVPPGLDQAVLRCLEKKASDRFQSVSELAAALSPYASRPQVLPQLASEPPSGHLERGHVDSTPPVFTATDDDEIIGIPGERRSGGWGAVVLGLALSVLCAVAADRAELIRIRDYTDGWFTPARLIGESMVLAVPRAERVIRFMPLGVVLHPSSRPVGGGLTAEREVEIVDIEELTAASRAGKAERYERYLEESGLRRVDDALRELEERLP